MAQLDSPAAGGEPVTPDSAPASNDPFDAIADSFFGEEEENDAAGSGAAPELDADDLPDGEPDSDEAGPAIAPPVSWTAEEKAKFQALPRDVQETLARRESERERFIQSK